MQTIAELFERPIDRTIEEVIKVDQANVAAVRTELEEYVATDSIKTQFAEVLREIAEGPAKPREGIGMWISGFFGSGKSTFAKLLGYTLANRQVGDTTAPALFKRVVADERIAALLDSINARIPFESVIFDVSMDRGIRLGNERLSAILYHALLRELDYAEDFDLAELEITLEADGKLDLFQRTFLQVHGKPWTDRRESGLAHNEAGAALSRMDPVTYPTADSYAQASSGRADISANKLAERAFELMARRRPGKALLFVVDEVGQYVSRSVDKMLDLQAVVQAFGVEGRNRTEARKAVSPHWIVVTSQEKLDEVVTALDNKKIELARLQERFRILVDLKQSDISTVTSERVLKKKPAARDRLCADFTEARDRIKGSTTLERSSRNLPLDAPRYAALYPYLPYQIDLCIDIVAGLRLKRGAHRHVGGSNRTIIKQAQQMMINDRTRLADEPIGAFVTLDRVYELLYMGNLLPNEVAREIDLVVTRFPDQPIAHKVIKAIALLESVKDFPRTKHNLAVVLHPGKDAPSQAQAVGEALQLLEKAQFIRQTEDGFKLLTNQEKHWETRRSAKDPKQKERNLLHQELIKDLFSEPKLRAYRYKDLRGFRVLLRVEGETADADGEIPLEISLAPAAEQPAALAEARAASVNQPTDLFWVLTLDDELREQVAELYRSNEMIADHDRLAAQNPLGAEEAACLADEKSRRDRIRRKLRALFLARLEGGATFFRGVQHDATSLGAGLTAAVHGLLDKAVPQLYPRLEIGVLPLAGNEVEKFLASANLAGLPTVFHEPKPERALLVKRDSRLVPNLGCDLCRELLGYIQNRHAYGERVTGKLLENHFAGAGYGWDRETLRLGLALLFRGGAMEVTHQGRKYRNYAEDASRPVFTKNPDFRAAAFSPRETLDLKILAAAARRYEEITGKDVNIEEGALAEALKTLAAADKARLVPLEARFGALQLPGAAHLRDLLAQVQGILELPPDDCVKTLAGDGQALRADRERAWKLEKLATEDNLRAIASARLILAEQWPALAARQPADPLPKTAETVARLLESEDALESVESLRQDAERLARAYRTLYEIAFEKRRSTFSAAREAVKGHPDWLVLAEKFAGQPERLDALLAPLSQRADPALDLPPGASTCRRTGATLGQLESDVDAVEALTRQVLRQVMALAAPEEKVERVAVARLCPARLATTDDVDAFLHLLRDRLTKAIAQGATVILE